PLAEADISTPYDTQVIDKTGGFKIWTLTSMVQEWINSAATNMGVLINSDASKARDRYRYFASTKNADQRLRPYLSVKYKKGVRDTTPPVMSITASAASITWTTNEGSDSQIDYGTSTAYGSSTSLNATLLTAHSAALNGLSGSTVYHFRVRSCDAAGNVATSNDVTFTTLDGT